MLTTLARPSTAMAPSQMLVRQQPQAEQLERKQQHDRDEKHEQRRGGGSCSMPAARRALNAPQRNARDEPADDRLEMLPQPRLEQEDEREQDPERAIARMANQAAAE